MQSVEGWKNHDLKKIVFDKIRFFLLKSGFWIFQKICIFTPRFYQIFDTDTDLSAQSHKQHGRHASAISSYTLAEQKVSN